VPATRPAAGFALVLAAVAAVSFGRVPDAFLHPVLGDEDGPDMFGFFYRREGLELLLRSYRGYVILLPNLMGWAALAAPVRAAPHLLALGPLALASLGFAWLSRRTYRALLPSDALRWGGCLVLALAPLTGHRFLATTICAGWSGFLLLALWSLAPPPRTGGAAAVRLLGMSALAWSHPLSALLVPAWLLLAIFPGLLAPGEGPRAALLARLFYLELAAAALLYQLAAVDHGALRALSLPVVLERTAGLTLERVVFGAVFGDTAIRALRAAGRAELIAPAALAVLAAAGLALARARARIGPREAFALAFLAWGIAGAVAASVLGRRVDLGFLATGQAPRLFWVPRLLFLVLLIQCAGLAAAARRAAGARPAPALRAAGAALLVAWLAALNLANADAYQVSREEGLAVRAFAAELARQERELGGRAQVRAGLERGFWSIAIQP